MSDAQDLPEALQKVVFEPGEMLFNEHELSFHFFILISGEVEVYKTGENGDRIPLSIIGEGTSIGEFAMLDRRPRSASAVALTRVECTRVSSAAYQHLLDELPGWAVAVMTSLVDRIRAANEIIRLNVASSSQARKDYESTEYEPETGIHILKAVDDLNKP